MGSGGGTTVQNNDPWVGQQPYLRDIFGQAQSLYEQGAGTRYYPGSTVAPFAPQTQAGLDLLTQRAIAGSPQQDAMGNYLTRTLSQDSLDPYAIAGGGFDAMGGITPGMGLAYGAGQPLDYGTARSMYGDFMPDAANPYLDQMYQTAADQVTENFAQNVMPALNMTFGGGGRTGSGLHQLYAGEAAGETTDALAKLAADIYAPAYESERDRLLQATQGATGLYSTALDRGVQAGLGIGDLGMTGMGGLTDLYSGMGQQAFRAGSLVPTYSGLQYSDIENLMQAGAITQDQAQAMIDAARERFDFYQQAPLQSLANYANIVQGMPAGYGTTQTDAEGNPIMGALGGGLMGYGLSTMVPALGPYGVPLAIGGAALGLF